MSYNLLTTIPISSCVLLVQYMLCILISYWVLLVLYTYILSQYSYVYYRSLVMPKKLVLAN